MEDKEEARMSFVCINCGQRAPEVYRQFQGGTLKIAHCVIIIITLLIKSQLDISSTPPPPKNNKCRIVVIEDMAL